MNKSPKAGGKGALNGRGRREAISLHSHFLIIRPSSHGEGQGRKNPFAFGLITGEREEGNVFHSRYGALISAPGIIHPGEK